MQMTIVGIFDRKAQIFISLEPTANTSVAVRQFQDVVNKTDGNPISKWPEDYSLWDLGQFETETGEIMPNRKGKSFHKKLIIEAKDLKTPTPSVN